jgi:lambda repressor-like predicted transcriptional regulator
MNSNAASELHSDGPFCSAPINTFPSIQDSHDEDLLAELEPLPTSTAYLTRMPNHAIVTLAPALSHCSHKKEMSFINVD